jgi:hypothetical protein
MLKTQLDALDARIAKDGKRQRERFWLRTLKLGLVSRKAVLPADPALPRTSALVFEDEDGTFVRLRRSDHDRLYVLSDSKPIERWPNFMRGLRGSRSFHSKGRLPASAEMAADYKANRRDVIRIDFCPLTAVPQPATLAACFRWSDAANCSARSIWMIGIWRACVVSSISWPAR